MRTDRDRRRRRPAILGALLGLAALPSCAPALPSRLYTLLPAEAAVEGEAQGPALGLDPVTLPAYLDRPEIVTRAGGHQVRLGESDKWVEPLQPMFRRRLEERLRGPPGPARWSRSPRRAGPSRATRWRSRSSASTPTRPARCCSTRAGGSTGPPPAAP